MGTEITWLGAFKALQNLGLDFDQADVCLSDARQDGSAPTTFGDTVLHNPSNDRFVIEVSRI